MRRIQLVLLSLFVISAGSPRAQVQGLPVPPTRDAVTTALSVARVMSFDHDADARVTKDELPERMKGLMVRGDTDGDGALDRSEIAELARAPVRSSRTEGRVLSFPTYQVPLDTWFPDRSHIEGALADLKLQSDTHATAIAVVETHAPHVDAVARRAAGHLLRRMESLLTIEQLAVMQTALDRQGTTGLVTVQGALSGSVPAGVVRAVVQFDRSVTNVRRFIRFSNADLAHVVDQFALPPDQSREARAAVESYRAALRTSGEEERACLVDQMQDIMTGEERDDFRAALARRSAVPTGIVGGVVGGFVPPERVRGVISVAPPIAAPAN